MTCCQDQLLLLAYLTAGPGWRGNLRDGNHGEVTLLCYMRCSCFASLASTNIYLQQWHSTVLNRVIYFQWLLALRQWPPAQVVAPG
jgi:hypothetical protein